MKLKTKKAAAKRFKITSTGKVLSNQSGKRHLLGNKSSKLKRRKGQTVEVHPTHNKQLVGMLAPIL